MRYSIEVENHTTPTGIPRGDPFTFRRKTYQAKGQDFTLVSCEKRVILTSVVLSQYTRVTDDRLTDRQTD